MVDDKIKMSIASMVTTALLFGTLLVDWKIGAAGSFVVLLAYLVAGRRLV